MNPDSVHSQAQNDMQAPCDPSEVGSQSCQWAGCDLQFGNAEALFGHVNEDHVGRNSRGNLCLECRWGSCTVSKSKRDHLISHIKSHLSYKPYQCEVSQRCSARFKHMSDLKRHEGTHRGKSDSSPVSNYNVIQGSLPVGLTSPEQPTNQISIELMQASLDGTIAPADVNAIHTGSINPGIYPTGLPPSPMPTPSMNPHEGGRTAPIDMANYGLFNTDGAPNITTMETDPLVSTGLVGVASSPTIMMGTVPGVSGASSAANEHLPPGLAQEVYVGFLSAALNNQSQQTDLTSGMLTRPQFPDPASVYPLSPSFPPPPLAGTIPSSVAVSTIPFSSILSPPWPPQTNFACYQPSDASGKRSAYPTLTTRSHLGSAPKGGVGRRRRRSSVLKPTLVPSNRSNGFLL